MFSFNINKNKSEKKIFIQFENYIHLKYVHSRMNNTIE